MTNSTIKNMEMVLLQIKKEIMNNPQDGKATKTLIHSYLTMLSSFNHMNEEEYVNTGIAESLEYQRSQLVYLYNHIEVDIMSQCFKTNNHIGVNNYATVLEKIKRAVTDIQYRSKSIAVSKKRIFESEQIIKDLLDLSVKSGTLITFYDDAHRGSGKTTALIKKAHELDAVLIVSLSSYINYVKELADKMGLNIDVCSTREVSLAQYRSSITEKGYLVDELVDDATLKVLSKYKLHGGFKKIQIK